MSEITLQEYQNEIDQLIDESRYLEALAHLRHVLKQYPRYFEAYYLLGKAMLDTDLPELATDMFRRALSANPEHLVSRIGLGLAHERRDDLDAAIWNLERALEIDPGNEDIADELRRMVGRRDGVEPDYVPQTQAGLARLYIRGGRYGRAAEELRALLDVEPSRPDLLTALAEAYWRDEQFVQASEVCQNILDTMPHNCKANLLLGSLWLESGQREGRIFLERAQDVDPEGHIATSLFGAESPVETESVVLERLVYEPDAMEVDRESNWFQRLEAASVTVGISEAPPEMTESEVRLVDITAGLESQIEIPEWLREIGVPEFDEEEGGDLDWMADLVEEEEEGAEIQGVEVAEAEAQETAETLPIEDIEAEVPDIEPSAATVIEEPVEDVTEAPEAEGEALGWLQGLTAEAEASLPEDVDLKEAEDWLSELGVAEDEVAAGEVEVGENAPDWLQDLLSGADVTEGEVSETEMAEAPAEAEDVPDWLRELEPEAAEPAVEEDLAPAEDMPDWLDQLEPGGVDEESAEEFALPEEGAPDWLSELQADETETEVVQEATDIEALSGAETGEAGVPEWLAALGPDEAAEEALQEDEIAAEATGDVPDWLRDFKPDSLEELAEEGEEIEEAPASMETELQGLDVLESETEMAVTEEDVTEVPEAEVSEGILGGDEALSWLESLTVGKEEELRAQAEAEAEARTAEILGRKPKAEEVEEVAEAVEEVAPTDEEVEVGADVAAPEPPEIEAEGAPTPEIEGDMLSGDDALAWLESFTVGKEEELRAQAEAEAEARTAELLGRRREAQAEVEPEPEAEVTEVEPTEVGPAVEEAELTDADVSETLAGEAATVIEEPELGVEAVAPTEAEAQTETEEMPDWLSELEPEAAEATHEEVVTPTEDVPDWLSELEPEAPEATREEAVAPAEDVTDWLDQLGPAAVDEATAEEVVPQQESGTDWLSQLQDIGGAEEITEEDVSEIEELLERGEADEEDVLGWLEALEPETAEDVEQPELQVADQVASDLPDWLEEFKAGPLSDLAEEQAFVEEPLDTAEPETVRGVEESIEALPEEDDALAWLESLAGAEQDEVEPEVGVEQGPSAEEDLETLSGDEALAWLESLTIGKEDVLRAQAEAEAEARAAEILGRKPEEVEEITDAIEDVTPTEEALEVGADVATPEPSEVAADESPVPEVDSETLSGDEALAWLESLTVGKEDELRAQAEAEAEARTAEILGRRREPEEEPAEVQEEPELEEAQAEDDALSWLESLAVEEEAPAQAEAESEVAQLEDAEPEPAQAEEAQEEPESVVEPIELPDEAPAEPESSEDALSWLQALSAEETEDLETEIEAQSVERIDQFEALADQEMPDLGEVEPEPAAAPEALEAGPFGWTAFESEAVPGEGEMAEEAEIAFGFTHFDDAADMPEAEAEALEVDQQAEAALRAEVEADLPPEDMPASAQPVTDIEALPESEEELVEPPVEPSVEAEVESAEPEMPIAEPEERVQPQVEVPADEDLTAPEKVVLEPEDVSALPSEVESETATEAETSPETAPTPVEEAEEEESEPEAAQEPRQAAQVTELTEDELNEMRAYTESHEGDEGARLALARALWKAGEADEAMQHYDELVQSRDKMDDVLSDLEGYHETRPNEASLLRTLGDAHMKEGNLDQALKFYNRAMDLL